MLLRFEREDLRDALNAVCELVHREGGLALLVGGCVRDSIIGLPAKDIDVEVYGVPADVLKARLAARFRIDLVGEAFGVIKLHHLPIDVSLPRRESKAGLGHKGFDVLSDPNMTVEEAASRRDFTINAMAYDPRSDRLFDYFNGVDDLRHRVLRHTSQKFAEDPLRVLRGMQFAARFQLSAAPATLKLCASMDSEGLARERIFEEWKKLVLKGVKPSLGLSFLRESQWLRFYPELAALVHCQQDPEWHPEGDVWDHTLLGMDAFAEERTGIDREDLVVGLAVLCHDFGKPLTTVHDEDHIRSKGHSEAGEAPTRAFLSGMTDESDLVEAVVPLVREHLRPKELFDAQASSSAIRRLACRVKRIDRLVRVAQADQNGRLGAHDDGFPAGEWLLKMAGELSVKEAVPRPIVMGRHLIELGMRPGPGFKSILDACYEAQLDGKITCLEDGIALVRESLTG
ncbi:MAG TPA: HD domain-containing protein [Kiritimatiellia bacterium]|nr:HD domain-containing protein [Kiritimatiellia bacterium]